MPAQRGGESRFHDVKLRTSDPRTGPAVNARKPRMLGRRKSRAGRNSFFAAGFAMSKYSGPALPFQETGQFDIEALSDFIQRNLGIAEHELDRVVENSHG